MPDTFNTTGVLYPSDPAIGSTVINYSGGDQVLLGKVRGIHISTAGTLKVDWADGSTDTLVFAVGTYPYCIVKIYQTGSTTAAGSVLR